MAAKKPAPVKKVPMRKCTGCREMKNKKELVRVVKTDDNRISVDETGKRSGRGAYICKNMSCLEAAIKNKGLEKSFKCKIPEEIYVLLREELESINSVG